MRKIRVLLIVVLPILVVVAALVWTTGVFKKAELVDVVEVKLESLQRSIATNGKVEADPITDLRAPAAGICRRTGVSEGSRLAKGDVILWIEDESIPSQKAAAQAELDAALLEFRDIERGPPPEERNQADAEAARAQLAVDNARKLVQSNEWLLARDAISRFEVEQSRKILAESEQALKAAQTHRDDIRARYGEMDRRRAQSRIAAAQSRIKYLDSATERLIIRAPANGTLYQLSVKDGAYLNPGEPIGLFADLSRLRLRAYVDEPDIGHVTPNETVVIRWDAHPQERWQGRVVQLPAQVVELGTRSVAQVICSIEDPKGMLLSNINVDVEIEVPQGAAVKSLPRGVVFPDGSKQFVWMIRSGRLEKRYVQTGRSTNALIEIADGLALGDKVIDPGDTSMDEGMKVTVRIK